MIQADKNRQHLIQSALTQLTNSQEAKHYLSRFHSHDELRFAVVKVGGGTLAHEMPQLTESLALLANLGLTPIVLHGAGVQLDAGLAAAGIESVKQGGLRVTDTASMEVIRPVMYQVNHQLVEALEQQGVRATGLVHGVFECDYLDQAVYGLVGAVRKIHVSPIRQALKSGAIPVLSCLGETASGQVVNINADVATRELVWQLNPHKIIFVTPTGGILDDEQQIISAIQLNNDYAHLMRQEWLHSGMQLKLEQIKVLLEPMGLSHSVSITSSKNLARELFTHQGAGTFINLGEQIHQYDALDHDLQDQLTGIFEQAFERQFKAGFWSEIKVKKVYLAESGRAAALVTEGHLGQAYLHKFAVSQAARGEGLAGSLWQHIKTNHPQLYWRSRNHNHINTWYFKQADVTVKSPTENQPWVGFSCGLNSTDSVACLAHVFEQATGWQSLERAPHINTENKEQKHA